MQELPVFLWIVLAVSVLLVLVAVFLFVRVRKEKRASYADEVFRRLDDAGSGSTPDFSDGIPEERMEAPEKANAVPPYTSWDKEEVVFGGFVQGGDGAVGTEEDRDVPDPEEGHPGPKTPESEQRPEPEPKEETPAGEGKMGEKTEKREENGRSGLDAAQALLMFKSHELLLTLTDGLRKLAVAKTDEIRKERLGELQTALKLLDAKSEWERYRACFEQMYPGFWPKVEAEASEEMTPYELRLCALLSLGMGTKEIADLTNRSVRTVETSIYKIRKKLGMGPDEKTSEFFRRFLQD